jgi:hypothetical protein
VRRTVALVRILFPSAWFFFPPLSRTNRPNTNPSGIWNTNHPEACTNVERRRKASTHSMRGRFPTTVGGCAAELRQQLVPLPSSLLYKSPQLGVLEKSCSTHRSTQATSQGVTPTAERRLAVTVGRKQDERGNTGKAIMYGQKMAKAYLHLRA